MMLDYEAALELIRNSTRTMPARDVPLPASLGRYLAADTRSTSALPRFDASAVDGYALRSEDTRTASPDSPGRLLVRDSAPAGMRKNTSVVAGSVVRIFTGAMIPKGADCIVMQEHVLRDGDAILIDAPVKPKANVRFKGEEFQKSEMIFRKGTYITPPVLGMLAAIGRTNVLIYDIPRVEVIVTGNELADPGSVLSPGMIYDSNGASMHAALQSAGVPSGRIKRISDDLTVLRRSLRTALRRSDIVIAVGGASVGDYDFVHEASVSEGVQIAYKTLAIKPGKPNMFGTSGDKLFFGLPGNPVAALLSFQLLVRPAIEQMMGRIQSTSIEFKATLTATVKKKPGRTEFLRGLLEQHEGFLAVTPVRAQDSHMLSGLAYANCIIRFPKDSSLLHEGDVATVTLLEWGLR